MLELRYCTVAMSTALWQRAHEEYEQKRMYISTRKENGLSVLRAPFRDIQWLHTGVLV